MAAITAIAAGVSLAATAGTTAASFGQAHKQKKEMRKAEKEARKAMIKARKKLDVNVYEGLSVSMTPYEKERDALLSQGTQAIETAVEGEERGAGATAGRLMAAQTTAQQGVTDRQTKQLEGIQKSVLDEDKRLQTAKFNLDVAEAEGAQLAARDAAQARAAAIQQGFEGIGSFMQQGLQAVPLYHDFQKNLTPQEQMDYYNMIGTENPYVDTNAPNLNPANPTTTSPPINTNTADMMSPFYQPPWGPGPPQSTFQPNPIWGL